ncbi:MAG: N-acetyl-alpha-D-glucosaminyl L-malate synthase BshA [Stygiobacter sp. RIFOXYC12_FULL_38_8]|nr:MAG: N-acetyl-alpha-D-glucosaminyl L-malate synthase BshA [Stygiobacter sp. RIFOXYA12_FULL_38_9]OGV07489.1 MAG: N-acetyl-alpha-D-glucosaminyl L-malate synthase BshA [Stygiobacter sp. RIFOXYB2_FULL_37_11]OGV13749.1 MAG: N-acetyl-alpha-D-glucosaminyl L-malate synthase BshA [Stygiobacter sp. RIFOXYC2_FULL_38_25]OGV15209.1 MAG: N-acetyl-alpha-D-glucosaminyl L-malate synthase BshA [Stygiobacter sp. RIFOXYA2_FULL_38_8]OGV23354.1 MAG: N-acetyl-alpha-D-glucosaminyl L-malate synthase BshA [Stygiobact
MKIGITCYPTYGGSGVVATELGLALAKLGHQVHFISYAIPRRLNRFVENIFFHEVEMSTYPLFEHSLYGLSLTSKMLEVIEYEKLDLMHVHYAIPHAVSAYMARKVLEKTNKSIKFITTLHGTDITLVGLEPSFMPLVKFSIEESDGVTAVSRFLKEKTLTNYNIQKEIEVIYNFIDLDIYKPQPSDVFRQHIAPNGEKVLVHTSNFRPVKRVPDTIRILEKVKKEIPAKLVLVGDGPDRSECERLARELDIHKDVIFLGKQDALAEILNAADIFLMPSQSESFGLSALEAMACGKPVISSSVGGLPELVIHNETGYIAEIGDVERMSKYAVDLLTNEKKYNIFAKNSLDRAVNHFDKALVLPKYIEYYEKILAS